jgi:hypothetical protein
MKKILCLWLLCVGGAAGVAAASPIRGEAVIYHYDGSHDYNAFITKVNSGTEVNLVAFSWVDTAWGNTAPASIFVQGFLGVEQGSGTNRWEENTAVESMGPTGPTGATGSTGATGPGSNVTGTSAVSRTLNGAAWQSSTTKDTELVFTVKIDNTLNLSGGAGGTVHLFCDSGSSPTTEVASVAAANTGTLTIGLALTVSQTQVLRYRIPQSHFCKLTTTNEVGTPTFTLVRQLEQTL